ncbi:hypothetical protein [Geobacillus stearothermophilus]
MSRKALDNVSFIPLHRWQAEEGDILSRSSARLLGQFGIPLG